MELTFDPARGCGRRLHRVDKPLAAVIKQAGPFTHRPEKSESPFQSLFRAIVYQQLSGKAAATILGRVMLNFPSKAQTSQPESVLATPDAKLPRPACRTPRCWASRTWPPRRSMARCRRLARLKKMSDEEIISRLVQVRGIGVWSVEMLLMFRLGRPDVLPVSDLGVRKGFMLTYRTGGNAHAERVAGIRRALAAVSFGGQLVPVAGGGPGEAGGAGSGSEVKTVKCLLARLQMLVEEGEHRLLGAAWRPRP